MSMNGQRIGLFAGMAAAVALTAGAMIVSTAHASPAAAVGAPAPDFTVTDSQGNIHSLDDFAGKRVIFEWTNHGCPFVQKHYADPIRNMQTLQSDVTAVDDGEVETVWLSVISSAPGKQGYVSGAEADELTVSRGAAPTAVILDPAGTLGKQFGAQTTPHMYIIDDDEAQTLVYAGAIDDKNTANPDDIPTSVNYVAEALEDLEAGLPVETPSTKAYGCSVKYG